MELLKNKHTGTTMIVEHFTDIFGCRVLTWRCNWIAFDNKYENLRLLLIVDELDSGQLAQELSIFCIGEL